MIRQTLRFVLVGALNTTIGILAIYSVLYLFKTTPVIANAIGFTIGLVVSFVLNRNWTFADTTSIAKTLPRYLMITIASYTLNLLVVVIGMRNFGIGPYLIQLFGVVVYSVSMFLGFKWFVFKSVTKSEKLEQKNIL